MNEETLMHNYNADNSDDTISKVNRSITQDDTFDDSPDNPIDGTKFQTSFE